MWDENKHSMGLPDMDKEHQKFCEDLARLLQADKNNFAELLNKMHIHTQEHFAQEEQWMKECNFSSYAEHKSEHDKILGELNLFLQKAQKGNTMMAKAYVRDRLPEWFDLHLSTMDSALAQKIKEEGIL